MEKYATIGASIITVVLLVIGSLTSIVGAHTNPSFVKESLDKSILASEQLNYYGLWTHPERTPYDSINSFNQWTPKPQIHETPPTAIPLSVKSDEHNSVNNSPITTSRGKTLYVGGTGPRNYSTIRSAVYAASNGDTVFVYSGTYHEGTRWGISINRSINLIGENRNTTIIDGEKRLIRLVDVLDAILDIEADSVTVSGFTIKNSGSDYADSGITLRSSHNTISGNIISNNGDGIHFIGAPYYTTNYNTISDNIFENNDASGIDIFGAAHNIFKGNVFHNNGIALNSYPNTFLNNSVNDKPLIYLEGESNKNIEDAGQVILLNCDNITIQHKDLSNASVGIILEGTHDCLISGNTIRSDKLGGIYCIDSDNNNISMNIISNTTTDYGGILIGNSKNNMVFSNFITLNDGSGVVLYDFSENNTILMNAFSDNCRGLVLTGGAAYNTVAGNVFSHDGAFIYGAWYNTFLNNSVNYKPLLYLEGESDKVIDGDAGQVILVSCDSITVQNQKISNVDAGISVVASNNCLLTNNIVDSNKDYGIYLTHSSGNNVSLNTVSNTSIYGIYVEISDNTIILWNTIRSNNNSGIFLAGSNYTTILSNTLEKNCYKQGYTGSIVVDGASYTTIQNNNFLKNFKDEDAFLAEGKSNTWHGNFWDRPRLFPKLIRGSFLHFNFDWHPAKTPYNIP